LPFSVALRGDLPRHDLGLTSERERLRAFQPISQGIPAFSGPDINTGSAVLPPTIDDRSPWGGRLDRGYIQS
jgi:hypothetical protein